MNTNEAPKNEPEATADAAPEEQARAQAGTEPAAGEPNFEPSFEAGDEDGTGEADGRIAMLEAEVADMKDKMLRAVAEQENVRRRAQKDVENAHKRSIKSFAGDLLAVADNLRRALDSIDAGARKENPALENLLIGVEMTERELMSAFERHGIHRMQPVGQPFDPNFHEAMFEIPDESQPAGTVGQVIETGYVIHDQPLRAAKVGVTKGGPKPEKQPETASETPTAEAAGGDEAGGDEAGKEKANYGGKAAEPGSHVDESL
ncbi:MAG: nucleotide exchange factor GrpE [Rhodospirillales bacterium]